MSAELNLVVDNTSTHKHVQSECIMCGKPLGQESKDCGFLTCPDHRACIKCHLPLNSQEIKWCLEDQAPEDLKTLNLVHPRCVVCERPTVKDDITLSIKQSEYDFLNLIRLSIVPDMNLSIETNEHNAMIQESRLLQNMDWDHKYAHLKMLEACVAQASIAVAQDRKELKKRAEDRDKTKITKSHQEALTSGRPTNKPADDASEMAIGVFMAQHAIVDRKYAIKVMKDIEKGINGLKALLGASWNSQIEIQQRALFTENLVKSGVLKQ